MVGGLKGVKYFANLDLVQDYYQMHLAEESRSYIAKNYYQFKWLPFGLRNAPSALQSGMQEVLKGFPSNKIVLYIVVVVIVQFTQHQSHY